VRELRTVLSRHHAPSIAFTYADREGAIGFAVAGTLPRRAKAIVPTGALPVPGWRREFDWNGYLAFEDNPQAASDSTSYLISANNLVAPPGSLPNEAGHDFAEHYRAARLTQLLAETDATDRKLDANDVRRWQNDVVSLMGCAYAPLYAAATDEPRARRLLEAWSADGCRATIDSAGAALFYEAHAYAFELTYRDEMSITLFQLFANDSTVLAKFDVAMRAPPDSDASAVFDDRGTPQREKRDTILRISVGKAVRRLTEYFGTDDTTRWRWGRLNLLHSAHQLGERGPLRPALSFGTSERPGGRDTVSWTNSPWLLQERRNDPHVQLGAVFRWFVDFGKPEDAEIVHYAGQSGRPFTEHFLDQFPVWSNTSPARYRPMTASGPPATTLVLTPLPVP
jgi:penicillin amidase